MQSGNSPLGGEELEPMIVVLQRRRKRGKWSSSFHDFQLLLFGISVHTAEDGHEQ
jgi:hypothetical protein